MKYACLIVDDEPLARKVLEKHLSAFPQFGLAGSCGSAAGAFDVLVQVPIHLLFLDIRMPGIDGLRFLRSLRQAPAVVFTTAYSEYAAESYELDAVDYLVKPISQERLEQALQKFLRKTAPAPEPASFLLIKTGKELVKLALAGVLYVEARGDYLMVYAEGGAYLTHMTLKEMEGLLPGQGFMRIHRSYIVALQRVERVGPASLVVGGKALPIGENFRKAVAMFFKRT